MPKVLRHYLIFVCSLAFTVPAAAQRNMQHLPATAKAAASQAAPNLQQLDAYIQKAQKDWGVPGLAVAIVKDDKVVFAKGYGVRELGRPEPVDENTLFEIASNSKSFTAAAIATLVDEGKLSWDDRVQNYLPWFELYDPYVTRELRIRDLLSHRSGLRTFSGDLLWYETSYSPKEVLIRARYLEPESSFRSQYGYQNLMFIAAGQVVEAVSGEPWQDYIRERFLGPLGMHRTQTSSRNVASLQNVASPYNEAYGKLRKVAYQQNNGIDSAGSIMSSAADLAQWLRLQLGRGTYAGKQIFSAAGSREMWTPHIHQRLSAESEKLIPSRHFVAYGLGWGLSDYMGCKVMSHGGALDGMFSAMSLLPEQNLGVVVLTSSETNVTTAIWRKIFDAYLNARERDWSAELLKISRDAKQELRAEQAKVEASRIANTKPFLALEQFAGTYTSLMYGDVNIVNENGQLVLRFGPAPNLVADLEHWHYDTFLIRWRPGVNYAFNEKGFVTFVLDETGKPSELKIAQPNPDFHFFELELKRKP